MTLGSPSKRPHFSNVSSSYNAARQVSAVRMVERLRGAVLLATIVVCSVVCASIVCLLYPFVVPFDRERHSLHVFGILWARTIVALNPWWKFRIEGAENLPPVGKAVVFVSNHNSQSDILALFLLGARFRWLSKESVFRVPVFGWAMRAIGYVGVQRGDKLSHAKCMKESRMHLDQGTPMVFFPEGTRSKTGALQPFKSGAFRLACEAGVDVQPITLLGTETLLPKGAFLPNVAVVRILVHPSIPSLNRDADELNEQTRAVIAAALPEEQRNVRMTR